MTSAQAALFPVPEPSFSLTATLNSRIQAFSKFPYCEKPYSKRNWGHPNHSMCSYQGKLKPAIAHFLISHFSEKGQTVLDPFSGVGTIPFEACLQERVGIGVDLSPIAYHSTRAKVCIPDPEKVWDAFNELATYVESEVVTDVDLANAQVDNINGNLSDYYHEKTFREILLARRYYQERQNEGTEFSLIFACLFHILHGNRPYALSRRSHPLTPFKPTGEFEYRSLRLKLSAKVTRVLANVNLNHFTEGKSIQGSVFQLTELARAQHLPNIDVIMTSPPFLNSTRFYIANWIRFWFSGWQADDFRGTRPKDFLETLQSRDLTIYRQVFNQFSAVLKPGGLAILHLGVVGNKDMGRSISDFAKSAGFRLADLIYEDVEGREKHGVRDQGSTAKHQFLFLEKVS